MESVGQVWSYLSELGPRHVHRSCKMDNIHYPIDIVTTAGQSEVANSGSYLKKPHEIICQNSANNATVPLAPYFWNADGVSCRDWKIRYCCENMWGTPSLYKLVSQGAKNKIPRQVSDTDVFIDKPAKKELFEDCKWGDFIR